MSLAPPASSLPRSSSNQQMHDGSSGGMSSSVSTPHLSHLRQQSSISLAHEEHPHYPTTADAYDVYEEIGVGAFATVYHASIRDTGEQVAIKVIDLDQFNTNWEEIRREILIQSLVHHSNVVRILTSFVVEQDLWLVMPLLEAGSCAHIMKTLYPMGIKDEAMVATILKEVLNGLLYFHKDGRLHRDLKAGNILISATGDVQLADFGVAGTLMENGDRKKARRTFTGTPCWMAPEVMEHSDSGYDEKADIWSFGITALELAYGRAPYAKFPPMKVMVLTLQEEPPTSEIYRDNSYDFSRHFHSMVAKCLNKNPEKRPSVKKLLEHKFFKAAKDKAYVVDKIVKRMPLKKAPPAHTKLLNLCQLRHPTLYNNGAAADGHLGVDGEKGRPVSVGSWVFDKAEFDEMKMRAAEEKESMGPAASRSQSLQQSYAGGDSTPKGSQQAAAAAGNTLAVPSGGAGHARSSSAGASSADESSDEEHAAAAERAANAAARDVQRILISAPAAASASSPQPPTPTLGGSPLPPAASAGAGVMSPHSEHQEGRFHVSEDADQDDEDEGGHDGEGQYEQHPDQPQQHGDGAYADAYAHQYENQYYPQQGDGDQEQDAEVHQPAFHDSYEQQQGQGQQQPQSQGETHVGRFTCVDDEEEDEDEQ